MLEIIKRLKAPKGQYNSFGKYKYRSCEDILEAVKPLLIERGLILTLTDEVVCVGTSNYVKATATLISESGRLMAEGWAREDIDKKGMDAPQMTGTASSYARKYALNGLFLIDDTKDADTDEYHNEKKSRGAKAPSPNTAQATPTRRVVTANTLANKEQVKAMLDLLEAEMHKVGADKRDFSPVLTLKDLGFEIEEGVGKKVADIWFNHITTK